MTRKLSELSRLMNDPVGQIEHILFGANLLRAAEHEPTTVEPSPEYTEAYDLLEPHSEFAEFEGDWIRVIPLGYAVDLIADNYERRAD